MLRQLVATLAAALVLSCNPQQPSRSLGARQSPIVGGTAESGLAAVGALTLADAESRGVSFCTGTLVAPSWVLTAAHCVAGPQAVPASQLLFFVGEQTPGGSGSYFEVSAVEAHGEYVEGELGHDLALVMLASAVPAELAVPVALGGASANLLQPNVELTYVGYGATSGVTGAGAGIRRSATFTVSAIQSELFETEASDGAGLCFGDAGAPGLSMAGTEPRLVGVALTCTEDCTGLSVHARVDLDEGWIQSIVMPGCKALPDLCGCANACRSDGTCDDAACELDCEALVDCLEGCADDECTESCHARGKPEARAALEGLMACLTEHCAEAEDFSACREASCATEYLACLVPDDCDLLGGDCGELACSREFAGRTWCVETAGVAAGESCAPDAAQYQCLDGHACLEAADGARCARLCRGDSDCGAGSCAKPAFEGLEELGACACGSEESCNGKDDDCDGEIDEGCAAGPDAGVDEGSDAGAMKPDAGVDEGSDAGSSGLAPEADPAEGSGCGCTAPGSAPSALALLTLLGLGRTRRRRR